MRTALATVIVVVMATIGWLGVNPFAAGTAASSPGSGGAQSPTNTSSYHPPTGNVSAALTPDQAAHVAADAPTPLHLPAGDAGVPWMDALEQNGSNGSSIRPLTSLPNLDLLEHPASSVAAAVTPAYEGAPAPLGLADYGLGSTPYAYNTSHFLGQLTVESPPNVTDPGGWQDMLPDGSHLGYVGSLNEFSVQLNTVAVNITFPGNDSGVFWTQNVVDWNDTAIHFVDDTFNLTSPFLILRSGTIQSGCNNTTAGVNRILYVFGDVFECIGTTIPLSPAAYPVTLQLYNNLTVNAQERDQLTYGYRIDEAGLGKVYTGVSDTIVFANPSGKAPLTTPGFSVDGFAPARGGLLADAEFDLGGAIGGDNAVFRSFQGTMQLEFSNQSSGGWANVPSAYNFGSDTGETSEGIADYWEPDGTLGLNQGPSWLYGLWNTSASVAAPPGWVQVLGSLSPSDGFVFVSNTPESADPFAEGALPDNYSWFPTNDTGGFATLLPPLGGTWSTAFLFEAFADGYAPGGVVLLFPNDTNEVLTLTPEPGSLNAPLYAFSNAEASSLAASLGGSGTAPFDFQGLTVDVNASFNRLNDYGYPSFELALFEGVTQPVDVDDVVQGPDSGAATLYFIDTNSSSFENLPDYSSGIVFVGGIDDQVADVTFGYAGGPAAGVVFWGTVGASAANISMTGFFDPSPLVVVGGALDTLVENINASYANAVKDVSSIGTVVRNVSSEYVAVRAVDSSGGNYSQLSAPGADAFSAGSDVAPDLGYDPYYNVDGTTGATVDGANGSIVLELSQNSSIANVSSMYALYTLLLLATNNSSVRSVSAIDDLYDVVTENATGTSLFGLRAVLDLYGAYLIDETTGTDITGGIFLENFYYGVAIFGGTDNLVYYNSFFGNNGATSTYSASNIQAYSVAGNAFNTTTGIGNYWADWHSFNGTRLNPYRISNGVEDHDPVVSIPGMYLVTFVERGLATVGIAWTVAVDGLVETSPGVPKTPTTTSIAFLLPNGSFPVLVPGPSGYVSNYGDGGTVYVAGADQNVPVHFERASGFSLVFGETGLGAGTSWCVTIDAAWKSCQTTSTIRFLGLNGGYWFTYTITPIPGMSILQRELGAWTPEDAGSILLVYYPGIRTDVAFGHTVTFEVLGGPPGNEWSVAVGGGSYSSEYYAGPALAELPNGTYRYHIYSGYAVSPASGTIIVAGNETVLAYIYTLTFRESVLPNGTRWSVTIEGSTEFTTSTSVAFYEADGRYPYRVTVYGGDGLAPASGIAEIIGANHTVTLTAYTLTFVVLGLPPLLSWYVTLGSRPTVWGFTNLTGASTVSFLVGDGRFGYVVGTTGGNSLSPRAGTVVVNGANRTVGLSAYAVSFTERGLPNGTTWTVTVDGIQAYNTTYDGSGTITFYEGNSTFGYRIAVLGDYASSGSPRTVVVDGRGVEVAVTFTAK